MELFHTQSFCAIRSSVNTLIAFSNAIRLSAHILIASASALIVFCRTHPPSPARMLEGWTRGGEDWGKSFPVCIHRPQRGRTMRNRGWSPKGEPVDRQRHNSPTPAVSHSTLFPLPLQRVWYSVVTLSHPGFNWLIIYILQAWQQYDNKNKDKICCHACKLLFISRFTPPWRRDNKKRIFLGRRRRWVKLYIQLKCLDFSLILYYIRIKRG